MSRWLLVAAAVGLFALLFGVTFLLMGWGDIVSSLTASP